MNRRRLIHLCTGVIASAVLAATGCSTKKSAKGARRLKRSGNMGNLLVDEWVKDLKNGSPQKQANAAKELGNMGSNASSALPALESLTSHADETVKTAVNQAIVAIKKKK